MFSGAIDFDFGSPTALQETYRRLVALGGQAKPFTAKVDLNDVVTRFYKRAWPDPLRKRRDYRVLPWALAYGAPPLYSSQELPRLLTELDAPRPTQILGMLDSYLKLNSDQVKTNGDKILKWVVKQISSFEGKNQRVIGWKPYLELLVDPRSQAIATEWLESVDLEAWIRARPFPISSHLTQGLLEECAQQVGSSHYPRCDDFMALVENVVKPSLGDATRCFDELLQALVDYNPYEPNTSVINYALMQFGDPHLDSRDRWSHFKPSGRKLITQWISAEDLRIFFDEITGDRAGRERLDFWRAYLDEDHVTYSKIVLCDEDRRRASSSLTKHLATGRHGLVTDSKASAFVVRIGEYFFIEFSGANNACYIYETRAFSQKFFASTRYLTLELKNKARSLRRLSHTPGWQPRFDATIKELTGIKVSRGRARVAPKPLNAVQRPTPKIWTPAVEPVLQDKSVEKTHSDVSPTSDSDQQFAMEVAALVSALTGRGEDSSILLARGMFSRLFDSRLDPASFMGLSSNRQLPDLRKRCFPLREWLCLEYAQITRANVTQAVSLLNLNRIRIKSLIEGHTWPAAVLGIDARAPLAQALSASQKLEALYAQRNGLPNIVSIPVRRHAQRQHNAVLEAYKKMSSLREQGL